MNRLYRVLKQLGNTVFVAVLLASSQQLDSFAAKEKVDPIPPRKEGIGPYNRLILRGAYMINGTGAPAQGPVDIIVENDRIKEIRVVGAPGVPINPKGRPALEGGKELDVNGMYILPGFIDTHLHLHTLSTKQNVQPEYVLKLWLAHGITSGRTNGLPNDLKWQMDIKNRLDRNEITGPRIHVYPEFASQRNTTITTPEKAREWVRKIKKAGGSGVKFFGAPEKILWAGLDEANKQGLNSTMHHAQTDVPHANVLDTSGHGLKSMEHWYGLPEAMFEDKRIQDYPNDYIFHNEQQRFAEAGKLWKQAAKPGSEKWNEVMQTLLDRDFGLSPTFGAYLATRDRMRMSRAVWHENYTMASLWDWFRPKRTNHGSYFFDWSYETEIAWKENYELWMQFVNEYKNKGGRVSIGSDSGYTFNLYGFGYVQEMENLREAGFSPLEVIQAATLQGAKMLRIEDQVGTIQVGKKADFVIVKENPLQNLHVLFGTGAIKLNDETGDIERTKGIRYTIKDGIVYDTQKLLQDVREIVDQSKKDNGLPLGIMPLKTVQ